MAKDLIFIIDRSRSAYQRRDDVMKYFDQRISQVKDGDTLVTLALFDDKAEILCFRQPADIAAGLLRPSYYNIGNSSIYDGICDTIEEWDTYMKKTGGTIETADLCIITDGMDTGSVRNEFDDMEATLSKRKTEGWQVLMKDLNLNNIEISALKTARTEAWEMKTKSICRQARC